jgi:hypothetical protein
MNNGMCHRTVLSCAVVVAALAAPSEAAAVKNFSGKTQQNRTVTLRIGDDNLLDRFRINWLTRRCTQAGTRLQHITPFTRPYDESTPDAFRDAGSFVIRDDGGVRIRVSITITGQRRFDPADPGAESWSGTMSARAVVRRRGRVIDRCRRRPITWNAALVG